jgi:cytochrome c553
MRGLHTLIAALFVFICATDATADDYSLVPDSFVSCTTCHGVELRGNASVDAPRLNGMEGWYVRNQMLAFKQGRRGTHPEDTNGLEMQPQAAALTEREIEDAVAFVAALPVRLETIEHSVTGDAARGSTLYATCGACHGAEGHGNKMLNAPRLAGQSDWYLVRQLEKYQAGIRGYDPADTAGTQMRASVQVLASEQDIRDVVAFINTLPVN